MSSPTQAELFATRLQGQEPRQVGPLPVVWPIVEKLGLIARVNEHDGTEMDIDLGRLVALMTVNRLMAPQPLDGMAEWASHTVLPELLDVAPDQLYDTRWERAFDVLHPALHEIWLAVATQAVVTYQVDLSVIRWDLTSFYFEGQYQDSDLITYGYSRDHRPDAKQAILGVDVAGRELVPMEYALLAGRTADRTTAADNLERLQEFLGCPELADPWPGQAESPAGGRHRQQTAVPGDLGQVPRGPRVLPGSPAQ